MQILHRFAGTIQQYLEQILIIYPQKHYMLSLIQTLMF